MLKVTIQRDDKKGNVTRTVRDLSDAKRVSENVGEDLIFAREIEGDTHYTLYNGEVDSVQDGAVWPKGTKVA